MATTEKKNEKHIAAQHDEAVHDQLEKHEFASGGFDMRAEDLPKGYYRSQFFIGTLIASSASWAAGCGGFALAAPILLVINADVGPNPNFVWIALGYTLPLAIGQTLIGRLSDLFGRRYFFIVGSTIALVGSIVCATAKNVPAIIGGTVLIGVGAASQLSVVFVMGELVPMKHRFSVNAFVYIWVTPYSGFAAAVGYAFVASPAGWRGVYYLLIATNALAVFCWVCFYFPPTFEMKHIGKTKLQVVKDFDFIGLILFSGGFVVFLLGLSSGGGAHPWDSAFVIGTLVAGGVALIAFVCWECFASLSEPLIPIHLFRNGQWVAMVTMFSISCSVYYAFTIVWPQIVFTLYTSDDGLGGILSSLITIGTSIGQCSSFLSGYIGKQRYQFWFTLIAGGSMLAACACITPDNKATLCVLVTLGLICLGYLDVVGLAMSGMVIKDQKEIGAAMGIATSIRSGISTIGTAIYTTILDNRLGKNIPAIVPQALIAAGLPASSVPAWMTAKAAGTAAGFASVKGNTPAIMAAGDYAYKVASADAYRTVFLSTIAFSAIALILSFFAPNVDNLMTSDVATTLHKRGHTDIIPSKGEDMDGTETT